jgi:hypothetical protein
VLALAELYCRDESHLEMTDESGKKLRLMDATDAAEHDESALYETSAILSSTFIAMAQLYPLRAVATGCLTAAATLLLGRPLKMSDKAVQAATSEFVQKIIDQRDVLREDATWMADQPKGVM